MSGSLKEPDSAVSRKLFGCLQPHSCVRSDNRVARYLAFEGQSFISQAKRADKADVTLDFVTPAIGFNVLWKMATGADRNAIMRAIQDKELQVSGDPMLLMWFQKSVKYLR